MLLNEEDYKLLLLINAPGVDPQDILSHNWTEYARDEEELWLHCKECGYFYGVSVFNNDTIIRWFIPDLNAKESRSVMSCDICKMESAIG